MAWDTDSSVAVVPDRRAVSGNRDCTVRSWRRSWHARRCARGVHTAQSANTWCTMPNSEARAINIFSTECTRDPR